MKAHETVCKSKAMALAIIGTIAEAMKPGTQKAALESVAEWVQEKGPFDDATRLTREGRKARILELLTKERDRMTVEQRQARAAFYLEGISA